MAGIYEASARAAGDALLCVGSAAVPGLGLVAVTQAGGWVCCAAPCKAQHAHAWRGLRGGLVCTAAGCKRCSRRRALRTCPPSLLQAYMAGLVENNMSQVGCRTAQRWSALLPKGCF